MEKEQDQLHFNTLDKYLERSNVLGDYTAPQAIYFEYWEVRSILPEKLMQGVEELCEYFITKYKIKNVTLAQKLSFYLWVKDELVSIGRMEREHLTPLNTVKNYKPSPRAKDFPELVELYTISKEMNIDYEIIKKRTYANIFDHILLPRVIAAEGEFKKE